MSEPVPVALFAYRRPDLLARCLASLRANGVRLIYAFSDGPRDDSVAEGVAGVRRLLRDVDWTDLRLVERNTNLGVGESELRGISTVLESHDRVIVVEEDLEFGAGTFEYLRAAMLKYGDHPRVMSVTAWNHARVTPPGVSQPYFSGRMSSLLWGTWKRAWAGTVDQDAGVLLARCTAAGIDAGRWGSDLVLGAETEVARGAWDLRFNLHMLARRGLCLYPARSMVVHMGYGPGATNSPLAQGWEDTPFPPPAVDSIAWPAVEELPGVAELWQRAVAPLPRPGLVSRAARRLARAWRRRRGGD